MNKKPEGNDILNGTYGIAWLDTEKLANIKSMGAKVTANYADIQFAEDPATHKKYLGWSGAGTAVLHKVDSAMAIKLGEGLKTGNLPSSQIVTKLEDPAVHGAERVQLTGVMFDELTLMKFAVGEAQEEEVPFTFSGYEFLDLIEPR